MWPHGLHLLKVEVDFSQEIGAKKRSGPKSSSQTPAKPSERKKGSSKNKPGSAGGDGKKITFSEKVVTALKNKVKEHNDKHSKKVTLSQLKKVYRRGAGAFSSSHRPGKTRGQWAMARVNMFLKMMRGGKVKKSYRAADQDIARGSHEITTVEDQDFFNEEQLALARVDNAKYGLTIEPECPCEFEELFDEEIEAEAKDGKKLNKPFRTPDGPKKFSVYVKNEKGNVVKVNFGDPNMEIKRDDPDRRKSFRARHNCDDPGPKWKARYWSCKMWEAGKSVTDYTKGAKPPPNDSETHDEYMERCRDAGYSDKECMEAHKGHKFKQ